MANNVLVQPDCAMHETACALTSDAGYRGKRGKLWAWAYFTFERNARIVVSPDDEIAEKPAQENGKKVA